MRPRPHPPARPTSQPPAERGSEVEGAGATTPEVSEHVRAEAAGRERVEEWPPEVSAFGEWPPEASAFRGERAVGGGARSGDTNENRRARPLVAGRTRRKPIPRYYREPVTRELPAIAPLM